MRKPRIPYSHLENRQNAAHGGANTVFTYVCGTISPPQRQITYVRGTPWVSTNLVALLQFNFPYIFTSCE
jgi:hypothetical protein